jgi:5'-3' exoribonuclease 1
VINTRRLQVVLDEMALWEEEVFQKEYSDTNWIKGKQSKHVKAMEQSRQRSQLGRHDFGDTLVPATDFGR